MNTLGTPENPLQVALVGSGPSGFYAAEAVIKSGRTVRVDIPGLYCAGWIKRGPTGIIGTNCIRNKPPCQAHVALEKTRR